MNKAYHEIKRLGYEEGKLERRKEEYRNELKDDGHGILFSANPVIIYYTVVYTKITSSPTAAFSEGHMCAQLGSIAFTSKR